jgi:hypothetical protein
VFKIYVNFQWTSYVNFFASFEPPANIGLFCVCTYLEAVESYHMLNQKYTAKSYIQQHLQGYLYHLRTLATVMNNQSTHNNITTLYIHFHESSTLETIVHHHSFARKPSSVIPIAPTLISQSSIISTSHESTAPSKV